MPLLNYTTQVPAARSIDQIKGMLRGHGARAVLEEYDGHGGIIALSFEIWLEPTGDRRLHFKVPVRPDAVLKVLQREKENNYRMRRTFTREQAVMIAWRIAKDWIEAQMAFLDTEMVTIQEIFLPYLITQDGRNLYEKLASGGFLLPEGKGQ